MTPTTPEAEAVEVRAASLGPLWPTLLHLSESNPHIRAFVCWYEASRRRGETFTLGAMLAMLIAHMDREHARIEKAMLDQLRNMPPSFFLPTPPKEADRE